MPHSRCVISHWKGNIGKLNQWVQTKAAYYLHIIRTVQPQGPYDLGGFSLGGFLAYEVARQLQELGETVNTLTMLDTFDTSQAENICASYKSALLQAANLFLDPTLSLTSDQRIDREQLDVTLDDDAYFEALIVELRSRRLDISEDSLRETVLRAARVNMANVDLKDETILPLPAPEQLKSYYFRNKNGLFFGDIESMIITQDNNTRLDHTEYWCGWQAQMPNLEVIELDAPSHMLLMADEKSNDKLVKFCAEIYAQKTLESA
ncbi:MAG: hypothetical protein COA42_14705 [Alteromonadaceae bacterium]|nr:MAG: hypothetical protein COA42_14705 [Alteromonadaceae bacterium]